MKLKTNLNRFPIMMALAFVGCWAGVALAGINVQYCSVISVSGGQGTDCPGPFTAYSAITNSLGGYWITPPTNTTTGTLTDLSGFPAPYASVVTVMRKSDLMTWCSDNSISFPVTNGNSFQLKVFVISSPAPTNGPLVLQITWQ
jgi:hypothetical protein